MAWFDSVAIPSVEGVIATGGDLVLTGTGDKQLVAYDARSGRHRFEYQARAGVNAPPMLVSATHELRRPNMWRRGDG